jgi:hypothetical protein
LTAAVEAQLAAACLAALPRSNHDIPALIAFVAFTRRAGPTA